MVVSADLWRHEFGLTRLLTAGAQEECNGLKTDPDVGGRHGHDDDHLHPGGGCRFIGRPAR